MSEQEVSLILSQMDPARAQRHGHDQHQLQHNMNPQHAYMPFYNPPSATTSQGLPNLPPLPVAEPQSNTTRASRRPTRNAAAPSASMREPADDIEVDGEGEDSDGFDDGDEYVAEGEGQEEDAVYEPEESHGQANQPGVSLSADLLDSGSRSPSSGKLLAKTRGRKPKAGSVTGDSSREIADYQKQRKENHKNVEKKRRETINDGIKRLAALVPGSDKNKSRIINQAAEYIEILRTNESSNIEKWTLDKLMTEKQMREMQGTIEDLKQLNAKKDLQIAELQKALLGR